MNQFLRLCLCCLISFSSIAQVAPDASQLKSYQGLFAAVVEGNSAELKKQILEADEIDARNNYQTPLALAKQHGYKNMIKILQQAGAR